MDPFDKALESLRYQRRFKEKQHKMEGTREEGRRTVTMKWKTRIVIRGRTLATFILTVGEQVEPF